MKAAFTRAYNKEVHLTPYSLLAVKKNRRGGESEVGGEDMDNQAHESEEDGENLQTDAMIKVRTITSGATLASFCCSLVIKYDFILAAAEEGQSRQADKRERRFWETQRQGQSQDQEVDKDCAFTD